MAQWITACPVILWWEPVRKWTWVSPKRFPRFSICAVPDAHCIHKYCKLFLHLRRSFHRSSITEDYLTMRPRDAKTFVSSAYIGAQLLIQNKSSLMHMYLLCYLILCFYLSLHAVSIHTFTYCIYSSSIFTMYRFFSLAILVCYLNEYDLDLDWIVWAN